MEPTTRAIRHEELLEQMGWVQSLARSLVRDPSVAEDVAQQTFFTALERPPRTAHSGAPLRAWLAAVTRTLARQSVRSETRRHAREARAARPEVQTGPTALDVVARGEIQRDVVGAVLGLDEPYRSTVLLRYLDGLSGPEIAERCGVSHAAVRQRLSRGLKTLRQSLDDQHGGDCRAWLAPLALPALGPGGASVASAPAPGEGAAAAGPVGDGALPGTAGGTATAPALPWLSVPALVGVVFTLLVSVVIWVLPSDEGGASDSGLADLPTAPSVDLPRPASAGEAPRPLQASAPPLRADLSAAALPDAIGLDPVIADVVGRVVDLNGAPVPDLRVRFEPSERVAAGRGTTLTTFSDGEGRFVFQDLPGRGTVLAASGRWATLFAGDASPPLAEAAPLVVVAPAAELTGRVRDEDGVPVPGARISLTPPASVAALDADLSRSWPRVVTGASDEGGRFRLARAPLLPGAELVVQADGFSPARAPLPVLPGEELDVTLTRSGGLLSGLVLDAAGQPRPDALVVFGQTVTRSDERGAFRLFVEPAQLSGTAATPTLVAAAPGHQPARLALSAAEGAPVAGAGAAEAGAEEAGGGTWPARVVLRLGPPPLTLRGRVVGPDGRPLAGAQVWLDDPRPLLVERDDQEGSAERTGTPPPGAPTGPRVLTEESVMAGHADAGWRPTFTDGEGRFELGGLGLRPCVVAALAQRSLTLARSAPALPGRDEVLIQLTDADLSARVLGRVVDRDGVPQAGASVTLRRPVLRVGHTTWLELGREALTDRDGRFRLGSCARDGTVLRVDGPGLVPVDLPVPAEAGEVELVVPARRSLRLLLDPTRGADRFAVFDAAGQPLPLVEERRDRRLVRAVVPLSQGRSPVLSVSDEATTLVLLSGDEERDRLPLALRAGRVNEIR